MEKNTKKFGQKYQIPIWYWYFLGIPNFWWTIDITMKHARWLICSFQKLTKHLYVTYAYVHYITLYSKQYNS